MHIDSQDLSKLLFYNALDPFAFQESVLEIRNRLTNERTMAVNNSRLHLQTALYHLLTESKTLTTIVLRNPDLDLVNIILKALVNNSRIYTLILEDIESTTMRYILASHSFIHIKHLHFSRLPYSSQEVMLRCEPLILQKLSTIQLYLIKFNEAISEAFINKLGLCQPSMETKKSVIVYHSPYEIFERHKQLSNNETIILKRDAQVSQTWTTKIISYNKLIEQYPLEADFYNIRGVIKRKLGFINDAIQDYSLAIQLNPMNAIFYYHRAIARKEVGLFQMAISDYVQAIALNPRVPSFYNNIAILRAMLGHYLLALTDINQALSLSPKDADLLNIRGLIHQALGNYKAALYDFSQAIEFSPNEQIYKSNYGYLLRLLKALPLIQGCIAMQANFPKSELTCDSYATSFPAFCEDRESNDFYVPDLPLEELFQDAFGDCLALNKGWQIVPVSDINKPILPHKRHFISDDEQLNNLKVPKKDKNDVSKFTAQGWCSFWKQDEASSPFGSPTPLTVQSDVVNLCS